MSTNYMSKSQKEEGKELEIEDVTTQPNHRQLQQLLDHPRMNNKLTVDILLTFLKKVITTNNLSFDAQILDKLANELQQSNRKPSDTTDSHKYPFDPKEIQNKPNNKTINKEIAQSSSIKHPASISQNDEQIQDTNRQSPQINQSTVSYVNVDERCQPSDISVSKLTTITEEIDIYNDSGNDSDASLELDDIENTHYSQTACPLTLLLCMPHPSNKNKPNPAICDKLKTSINSQEQCSYLSGSQESNAQSSTDAIQQQLQLTCDEIDPIRNRLQQYYNIILYPQKIFECTLAVFIATVINKSLVYDQMNDEEFNIWVPIYYLFQLMSQWQRSDNLERILLSHERSKLAYILSQAVFDLYGVNVNTLERILSSWVQQYMAYKAIEFTHQLINKTNVWLDRKTTAFLMKKKYILQQFDDVTDLFHNIIYTIKMQQIDGSYRAYKNNIGCQRLQLTIYSSQIMNGNERMYIVATLNETFQVKDLFSAKQLKDEYGIDMRTDLPMSLMNRRVDKLLCGYVRSTTTCPFDQVIQIMNECQDFFSDIKNEFQYNDKQCCKQSICLSPTTKIPTQKPTHLEKSKRNMTILQEKLAESIQNAIHSNDNKCKCFPVIWVDEKLNIYYRDDVLAVNISNNEWIGYFIRSNEYCSDWNIIQRQAKLYDASFSIAPFQWKNSIRTLTIKIRKEGKVLWYNCKGKHGRIKCGDIEYKFGGNEFYICDDWYIYDGMPVCFYDGRKKQRAINVRPINKEGMVLFWDLENKYGYIECGDGKFKFSGKDYLFNDSYVHKGMLVYFCQGRKLESSIHNKAINVKAINNKYNKQ